ncbi:MULTISPECIES: hypothetical protein [unclassified Nocardioides]|uniref:DUF7714 family protein n=1 Tax=unclassified Nocardioides TaxID=2615069 RepID=UPI000057003A|nr:MULTISPECIES: hypothetical protein [unclassified Nocardioides]ABL79422.1 hypothetical protein Noca_4838 [Nocardioides sp. JS614]
MISDPLPNLITRPYRGLSVQEVDVELSEAALGDLLLGRDVYRRTEFLLLHRGDQWALLAVEKVSTVPLFSPVVGVRLLAGPEQVLMIDSPGTDVGNASALAAVAAEHLREGVLAYAVRGRFEHINFIWQPEPVVIRVTEVVPPWPAKLLTMAQQVVDFDEDLPPIRLELDAVDIGSLAEANPAERYLLPCRGSGVDLPGEVDFLDTRPPTRRDWLMLGCERSLQFHRHFYGDEPARVDLCPRRRVDTDGQGTLTLSKCCLLERGVEVEPGTAIVPWGSNLDEVRVALRRLVGLPAPGAPVIAESTTVNA